MKKKFCIGNLSYRTGFQLLILFLSLLLTNQLQAQEGSITVRGKVTDQSDQPLPGATITIVGTTKGVITDNYGNYVIDAEPSDQFIFSFLGMKSLIIDVENRTTIDIKLEDKTSELDEVTVVAF
ncbi:MAG: carboxypeptidase-like regulatory domain-containing protein, partial [Proteiniphilum sp.]|nr:carboxypeptidase-like regulatory domain-containing protein [Proteiniphilum sp.]